MFVFNLWYDYEINAYPGGPGSDWDSAVYPNVAAAMEEEGKLA